MSENVEDQKKLMELYNTRKFSFLEIYKGVSTELLDNDTISIKIRPMFDTKLTIYDKPDLNENDLFSFNRYNQSLFKSSMENWINENNIQAKVECHESGPELIIPVVSLIGTVILTRFVNAALDKLWSHYKGKGKDEKVNKMVIEKWTINDEGKPEYLKVTFENFRLNDAKKELKIKP